MTQTKILIVEDESIIAMELEERLAQAGYEPVGTVADGESALGLVESERPDIVLMDIHLRGVMDGIDIADEIRTRYDIPLIYLTAHADEATLQRAKQTQPAGYLVKPFREQELRAVIEMAIHKRQIEMQVREKQHFIERITNTIPDFVYVIDLHDHKKTYSNVALATILGYDIDDIRMQGLSMPGLVHPEDWPSVAQSFQKVAALGDDETVTIEFRMKHAMGGWRWLQARNSVFSRDADSRVVECLGVAKDITENKRAEHLLEALNRATLAIQKALRLEDMIEAMFAELRMVGLQCAILISNAEGTTLNPKFLSYNSGIIKQIEKLSGLRAESLEMPIGSIEAFRRSFVDRQAVFVEDVPGVIRQFLPVPVKQLAGQVTKLLQIPRLINVPLIVENEVVALFSVQSGELRASDIPAVTALANQLAAAWNKSRLYERALEEVAIRTQAEAALRESQYFLSKSQAVAGVGSYNFYVDAGTWITSSALEDIFGIGQDYPKDVPGWLALVHPEDREVMADHLARHVLQEGNRFDKIYRIIREDDHQERWVHGLGELEFDQAGKPVRMIGTIQDITERKRFEESLQSQLQRLAALRAIDIAVTSSLDLNLTLDVIVKQTVMQLQVDAASVLVLSPYTLNLEYAAGYGFTSTEIARTRLALGDGVAGRAALERKMISVPRVRLNDPLLARVPMFEREGFSTHHVAPLTAKGEVKGVLEVFHRREFHPGEDWLDSFEALAGQTAIAVDNATLFGDLQRANLELSLAYDATIEGWSRALDLRDRETEGHTRRVADVTVKLARLLGVADKDLVHIRRGALLHDIGKMGVPDAILHKPGKLNEEEWAIMRKHPEYAHEMLSPIAYLRPALDIPCNHHEKWDGSGYPNRLAGEMIPFPARVFAIVDVWDALLSDRPYRQAWPLERVKKYLRNERGAHFDPRVLDAFLEMLEMDEGDY